MAKEDKKRKINEELMFDNSPIESDDYAIEAQILDTQIKKEGVKNIGVKFLIFQREKHILNVKIL